MVKDVQRRCVACKRNLQMRWKYTCELDSCNRYLQEYRSLSKQVTYKEAKSYVLVAKKTMVEMKKREEKFTRFMNIAKAIDQSSALARRTGKGFYPDMTTQS